MSGDTRTPEGEGPRGETFPRLDHVWLAYAFDAPQPPARVEAALDRVAAHYGDVVDFPLVRSGGGGRLGVVVWDHPEPARGFPLWWGAEEMEVGFAYAPTGADRLAGPSGKDGGLRLGKAIAETPERASATLNAPFAAAVLDLRAERLLVVNDALSVGRVYEMQLDEGHVWSNRLGALPLFGGIRPTADERGWSLVAGSGWFMRGTTGITGTRKLAPSTIVEAGVNGVAHRTSGALAAMVEPRDPDPGLPEEVAAQGVSLAREVAGTWRGPVQFDLSGGRDSRVCAAAAIAAGIEDAVFVTLDLIAGEADVARELLAAAPGDHRHVLTTPAQELDPDIRVRGLWSHLVHDGMRSSETLHIVQRHPSPPTTHATFTGHGGAHAHASFYNRDRHWRGVQRRGPEGPAWRLRRFFGTALKFVRPDVDALVREEIDAALSEGRDHGLDGPDLLDYFNCTDHFPNWSNFAGSASAYSALTTPAFGRAAFDTTPEERRRNVLHRTVTGLLVPSWREIPYFEPSGRPQRARPRIWQRPNDAAAFERILADESTWGAMFEPDRIRELWAEVKRGDGRMAQEKLFERIVFRATFEEHLRLLGDRATADVALAGRRADVSA